MGNQLELVNKKSHVFHSTVVFVGHSKCLLTAPFPWPKNKNRVRVSICFAGLGHVLDHQAALINMSLQVASRRAITTLTR